MKHPLRIRFGLNVLLALFFFLSVLSCSESGNELSSEDIATELANRLTDKLQFENGEKADGGPPPYHEGEDWPQVEFVDPPDLTVSLGGSFSLDVKAAYDFPEDIDGAMVWVQDATTHIDIRDTVDQENLIMRLAAELLPDPELKGRTFDLYVSLYLGEETGLHETWRITIPD